jgi:transposase-like protein
MYEQSFVDAIKNAKASSLSQSMKPEPFALRKKLMELTSWLPESFPIASRMMVVRDGITEIPSCRCGNVLAVDKSGTRPFQKFCSDKCNRVFSRLSEYASKCLYDIEWVRKHRYELKMSYDAIAELLGTSHIAIKNAIERLELPLIRYNETTPEVKAILMNKELLIEMYATGDTWLTVSEKLGVDHSTLVVYINKHGIVSRDPNSYEREFRRVSLEELEVVDFIKSIYDGEIRQSVKKITGALLELDIYLPDAKIGFEYNGLEFHTYSPEKTTHGAARGETYHVGKTDYAKSQGVEVVHIFSDMWWHKKDIVKSLIRAKLGKLENKIYARQCQIIKADQSEKRGFLSDNHIMGNDRSSVNYSLIKDGGIVAMMTFGKSRFSKKHKWELIRFCVKQNTSVVGGFTRLLKAFRKDYAGGIVSYADYSLSNGNVYEKNGFSFVRKNKPTGWGYNEQKHLRINRMQLTKKKIENALGIQTNYTEKQLRKLLKIQTIFDCGTMTYELV